MALFSQSALLKRALILKSLNRKRIYECKPRTWNSVPFTSMYEMLQNFDGNKIEAIKQNIVDLSSEVSIEMFIDLTQLSYISKISQLLFNRIRRWGIHLNFKIQMISHTNWRLYSNPVKSRTVDALTSDRKGKIFLKSWENKFELSEPINDIFGKE